MSEVSAASLWYSEGWAVNESFTGDDRGFDRRWAAVDCGRLKCGLFDLGAVPFARLPLKKKKNLPGCSVVKEPRWWWWARWAKAANSDKTWSNSVFWCNLALCDERAWTWRRREMRIVGGAEGEARWYHGDESHIAGWRSCSGLQDAELEIMSHRFNVGYGSPSARCGETVGLPLCLLLPHILAHRGKSNVGWRLIAIDLRRSSAQKCEAFTFQTWVLVDGQLSRRLCRCHIAANCLAIFFSFFSFGTANWSMTGPLVSIDAV